MILILMMIFELTFGMIMVMRLFLTFMLTLVLALALEITFLVNFGNGSLSWNKFTPLESGTKIAPTCCMKPLLTVLLLQLWVIVLFEGIV